MYKEVISPILSRLDSETWHVRARKMLHVAEFVPLGMTAVELCANQGRRVENEKLEGYLGNIFLENPLLVGAGWDKVGKAVRGLWHLGFAGVGVGSVLARPQDGNPKPRQFMLNSGVALNRLGFNSPGMEAVAINLESLKRRYTAAIIGISIGKNKDVSDKDAPQAHAVVAQRLCEYGDYFVINVSSPNTPGLRKLQDKGPLTDIIQAVNEAMAMGYYRKSLFVKIAPDLTLGAVDDVIQVAIDNSLLGLIAANTTINSDIKGKYGEEWRNAPGGLSGDDEDFRRMSTAMIAHIYKQAGHKLEIIGVGGVKDTQTALEKIKAGAKALQVVTAIRGEGPGVAKKINQGLVNYLEKEGVKNIGELVGINMK